MTEETLIHLKRRQSFLREPKLGRAIEVENNSDMEVKLIDTGDYYRIKIFDPNEEEKE